MFCTICPIIAPVAVVYFAHNYIVWWVCRAAWRAGCLQAGFMRVDSTDVHPRRSMSAHQARRPQPLVEGSDRLRPSLGIAPLGTPVPTFPTFPNVPKHACCACRKYQHVYVYQGAYQSGGLVRGRVPPPPGAAAGPPACARAPPLPCRSRACACGCRKLPLLLARTRPPLGLRPDSRTPGQTSSPPVKPRAPPVKPPPAGLGAGV